MACCLVWAFVPMIFLPLYLGAVLYGSISFIIFNWGSCSRDRMIVVFTATCAISAYHDKSCNFEHSSHRGVLDTTLCDKACQWPATHTGRWFSSFPQPIKLITEILLKVALSTIAISPLHLHCFFLLCSYYTFIRVKFDIYVFITISRSIPLLVNYYPERVASS